MVHQAGSIDQGRQQHGGVASYELTDHGLDARVLQTRGVTGKSPPDGAVTANSKLIRPIVDEAEEDSPHGVLQTRLGQ